MTNVENEIYRLSRQVESLEKTLANIFNQYVKLQTEFYKQNSLLIEAVNKLNKES